MHAKIGSLYDLLLFKAAEGYILDAHDDNAIDGDLSALDALASSVTSEDDAYAQDYSDIKESEKSHRDKQHLLFGLIMRTLRRHGHLDWAPTESDTNALEFLKS